MTSTALGPISQVTLQAGSVSPPLEANSASGNTNTQNNQRSIVMGEPIPIVFTRRLGKDGGVMLQPGCTEAAFSVDASKTLTAKYHLVLGEGNMFSVQRRDVSQIGLRRGTFSQTYDKRAGNWTPGNSIPIPATGTYRVASYNCGGGSSGYGTYEGMTTLSFITVCPDGDDSWKGQVSIFIRGGLQVTRLADGQVGPSSNVVDLVKYLITQGSRIPAVITDTTSLTSAANFINANLFRWDGVLDASTNLRDWLAQTLPYFLLRESSTNGKFGLAPVIPVNSSGTINTGTITPAFLFDETSIVDGSLEIQYVPLAERKPVRLRMLWRQQDECQWPLVRSSEVQYSGTPSTVPQEQHDLSAFATNENHVIKSGAYILARRRYVTHTARVTLRPGAASRALVAGDVVQLRLTRESSTGSVGVHNFLYQVERIIKSASGALSLELLHFPLDSAGRSIIACEVAAAQGGGLLLNPNTIGPPDDYSCDDNTVPADDSLPTSSWTKVPDGYISGSISGGQEGPAPATGSPTSDPLGERPEIQTPYGRDPVNGETISVPLSSSTTDCVNPRVQWLKGNVINLDGSIDYEAITGEIGTSLTITGALNVAGQNVTAVFTCDGSTPTPTNGTILDPVVPGYSAPANPYDPVPPYTLTLKIIRLAFIDPFGTPYAEFDNVRTGIISSGKYYQRITSVDGLGNKTYTMYVTDSNGQPKSVFTHSQGASLTPAPVYVFVPTGAV